MSVRSSRNRPYPATGFQGVSYRTLGRYAEAVRLDEETLSIYERVLGPEHPDTLRGRNNLAIGYRAVGRNREANELESQVE